MTQEVAAISKFVDDLALQVADTAVRSYVLRASNPDRPYIILMPRATPPSYDTSSWFQDVSIAMAVHAGDPTTCLALLDALVASMIELGATPNALPMIDARLVKFEFAGDRNILPLQEDPNSFVGLMTIVMTTSRDRRAV